MNADDFHWNDLPYSIDWRDGLSGTTYSNASTKIALNDPSKNTTLKQASTYHVKIDPGFAVDHSGKAFAGLNDNTKLTFKTDGDGTPPNINPRYPQRNTTSIQVGSNHFRFDIEFDEEVKAKYRTLSRENHPDVLMAKGVPQEFIDLANEKMAVINVAYDRIEKERG